MGPAAYRRRFGRVAGEVPTLAYFPMLDLLVYFLATLIYMFHIYIFHGSKSQEVTKRTIFHSDFYPLIQSTNEVALQRHPNRDLTAGFTTGGYSRTGV